jgi:two-component system response regulator YesN
VLWLCEELYFTICGESKSLIGNAAYDGFFSDSAAGYEQIKQLSVREDAARFIATIGNELIAMLQQETPQRAELIEQAKKYIYENISSRITLQEAAKNVCLSGNYLSLLFKKYCGESFIDFVNRCKIEKACELLRHNNRLIAEVGEMLSFENSYYFTRIFKRYTGITPSEYRKQLNLKSGDS